MVQENLSFVNNSALRRALPILLTFGTLMQCGSLGPRSGQHPLPVKSKMADSVPIKNQDFFCIFLGFLVATFQGVDWTNVIT